MPEQPLSYEVPVPTALLQVERTFAAEPERVFRAWTEPELVARWFGPVTDPPPTVEADVRVGGGFRIAWSGPEPGIETELTGIYLEVDPPKRLVYTFAWEGMPPAEGMGNSMVTVEFRDLGKATELRLTHELLDDERVCAFHRGGWDTSLERLGPVVADE